jgi:hypothetical protein
MAEAVFRGQHERAALVLQAVLAPKNLEPEDGEESAAPAAPPPPADEVAETVLTFLVSAKKQLELVGQKEAPLFECLEWLRLARARVASEPFSDWMLEVLSTTRQALELPGTTPTHASLRKSALQIIGLLYRNLR